MKSLLVIDGREVFSGSGAVPAIKSLTHTTSVVGETDFSYGGACAAMLEGQLLDSSGSFTLTPGTAMTYYTVRGSERTLVGQFLCDRVQKTSPHSLRFTAYDRMTCLDVDITPWLTALQDWPYTMEALLVSCLEHCGVELGTGQLPNGAYPVQRFVQSLTARQLVRYICQANACFARMDAQGRLCFAQLGDGGAVTAVRTAQVSDYATAPIARVTVRQASDDVGVSWPSAEGECYEILENPLLATFSEEALLPVVQTIAQAVVGLSYTPATVTAWDCDLDAGDSYTFQLGEKTYRSLVFSKSSSGSLVTLKSTGNPSRTAAAVYAKDETRILQGRLARVQMDVAGLSTTLEETTLTLNDVQQDTTSLHQSASAMQLRLSSTEQTLEGMNSRVTTLQTDADGMALSVVALRSQVDGKAEKAAVEELSRTFRFDGGGLTITGSATGMGIGISETQVAFQGGAGTTTVITPSRMTTTDLRVGKQLDVGSYSLLPRTNGNLSLRWTGG